MTVIGLMGYAGSGKDTVANILVEKHGFVQLAFADALKAQLIELNPTLWTDECGCCAYYLEDAVAHYGWDRVKEMYAGEARRLLQTYGQMRRDENPGYWIHKLDQKIPKNYGNLVISDVRYENEADYVRAFGGKLIVVSRPGYGPINGHESDTPIWENLRVDPDYRLDNASSIGDLEESVSELMRMWNPVPS